MITSQTLTSTVCDQLRSDILNVTFKPGERLGTEALALRYSVGATPIREALNRLSAEGLVTVADNRGFRVAEVSIEALQELTITRNWVTELALREAIRHGDQAWEDGIFLAYHHLSRVGSRAANNPDQLDGEWTKVHRAFHSSLIAGCKLRWAIIISEWLFDQADRYRHIEAKSSAVSPRDANTFHGGDAEHQAIMNAVITRDADEAVRLMNLHSQHTERLAIASGLIKHEAR
jgi:GntR family carbon starvation induced transcriptional regulator